MLYGIGATWNPKLSRPSPTLQKGLAGIKGLSFAYRLNTWGTSHGPPMIPANAFPSALIPAAPPALSSAFTWVEGIFGVEAPADMVTDANNALSSAVAPLTGAQTTIQTLLSQAQAYDSSSDQTIIAKAQACEAEAAGLINALQTLQTAAQNLQTQITAAAADPNVTKETAQGLKDAVSALNTQISTFASGIAQLTKDVKALQGQAQSGPGFVASLENKALGSVSTLTWLVGGGLMVYLLAPTFLPRMMSGIRKSR